MLVKTVMLGVDNLSIVRSDTAVYEAMNIMKQNNFLSIPVVDRDEFKGVIATNDIYEYYFNTEISKKDFIENMKVGEITRRNIPIINEEEQMEKAVALLERMLISFVAVVDDFNKFKGILTHKAVFREFNNAFGLNKGDRIAIRAYDIPGQISKISKIITENNADILSFVVVDTKSLTQVKEIIVRIKNGNTEDIKKRIKESGFKVVL